jgi:predicted nucleic acid-binding protein
MVPQSVFEFWVVATRPIAVNGLGLSTAQAEAELMILDGFFPLLNDLPTLFAHWRALVRRYDCVGKPAHDARYVAALQAHGLTHLLTFNGHDFARYAGITVLDPPRVVAQPLPPQRKASRLSDFGAAMLLKMSAIGIHNGCTHTATSRRHRPPIIHASSRSGINRGTIGCASGYGTCCVRWVKRRGGSGGPPGGICSLAARSPLAQRRTAAGL